jgi:hypothetical protein
LPLPLGKANESVYASAGRKMIDPELFVQLRKEVASCVASDKAVLDQLLDEILPLRAHQKRIHPRSVTSVALVGTDGGNSELRFDPFMVQVIRIVDSSNNQIWLEVVGPTTPLAVLDKVHFNGSTAISPLGRMMQVLGVSNVVDLSPVLRDGTWDHPRSPSWTSVYRELHEWAALLDLAQKDYGTDTLIVFDGFLRSKIFRGTLFRDYGKALKTALDAQAAKKRTVIVVGIAKRSKVLSRYRLALKLLEILRGNFPGYVEIPREVEQRAYVWSEYARGSADETEAGEAAKHVNGRMFFVKFGDRPHDAIWPVDVFEPQAAQAALAFGYLVKDAQEGFPIALYPRSLQKAHEAAALVGFDMDALEDVIVGGVRSVLGARAPVLDEFMLEPSDPAQGRY